ncbi:MAG TPA: DNA-formamidopyrimidine glycosylase family protein [Solirubrobacterales bacterium]|jgi:endonuclease-8|nr:DNA-formamidopyrimidine glycosylase family protein [Solirubrobacterales bacterium]
MAEGDTILRAKQRLADALVGQPIAVSAPNPRGRAAGIERLDGRTLEGIDAHGKHLMFDFGDLVLHSHLGMSGGWHVYPRRARWRRPRSSAWAILAGERADAVQFGGPTLRVLPAGRVAIDPQLARLGPDILADDLDLDAVVAKFRATDQSRTLGDALLDQRLTAGIGNIFKSEACFAAGTDPWRPLAGLTDDELRAVLDAAREQMLTAVKLGNRHRFRVYKHRGPCARCRGTVHHRGQGDANRTTWWCERCQT